MSISRTEQAGLGTGPVPTEPYRSSEHFELERTRIFARSWLLVAREEEVAEPGDFVRKAVEICAASIILTRGKNGKVAAFHNTCSHRNNQLVIEERGRANRFICRYHNWTYGNDGKLLGIPDEASFFGIDKAACGLSKVACETWEGWVFINLQAEPEVGLVEFLGDFAGFLSGIVYQNAGNPIIVQADLDCNWKVISDAFSESYHIPAIHPQTIGATFSSKDNPFAHILDARFFGPHRFVSMYGNPAYVPPEANKVERLAAGGGDTGSVIAAADSLQAASFLAHPSINPTRSNNWAMDVNHIWPNTHIDTGPGGFWTHQFWPLAVDKTRHEVRFYVPAIASARERFQQEAYVCRVIEVLLEDLSNVARTQRGLASRAKDAMQLQDNEILIRHQSQQVEKWVAAGSVAEALS
jgi:phenylpropionate dioxygenase-like ring-hydroxylating dioxygenase large terminal subunit